MKSDIKKLVKCYVCKFLTNPGLHHTLNESCEKTRCQKGQDTAANNFLLKSFNSIPLES